MKPTKRILLTMILLTATSLGYAQRGTGNNSGIARSNSENAIEQISGELQEVITEPCAQTTGRYSKGTHLLVKTDDDETQPFNVHLGPTRMVSDMTDQIKTGKEIQIKVFRTDDLPENQYIAKEFTSEGKTYELRNEDLRPFWAGNRKGRRGMRNRR
ncbi:MAG: hypothetical protein ACQER7_12790 [Bacteroidota bacterium]